MNLVMIMCFGYMFLMMLASFSKQDSPRSPIFYISYGAMIIILSIVIQIATFFTKGFENNFKQAVYPIGQDYALFAIFLVGIVMLINGTWLLRIKKDSMKKYLH